MTRPKRPDENDFDNCDYEKYDQFRLVGGPHCGHVIVEEINKLPQTIYTTGKQYDHDPPYTTEPVGAFAYMYVLDGFKFKFVRKVFE